MKINSENVKRQRMIVRRVKSGKSLVGLLVGLAVGAATSGCTMGHLEEVLEREAVQKRNAHVAKEVGVDGVRDIGKAEKP